MAQGGLRNIVIPCHTELVQHTPPEHTMSIYTENGYANRREYLYALRDEYGSDLVNTLITVFPASEDFDGLLTALEDAMDGY